MHPDTVLSNTSPIYYLSKSGSLNLLKNIYAEIYITEGIVEELKASGDFDVDLYSSDYSWIKIRKVDKIPLWIKKVPDLGKGESQLLALADSLENPLLIIDELLGRKIAVSNNYSVTGLCGVLLLAKRKGLLNKVGPMIEKYIEYGFYISKKLKEYVLKKALE